MAYSYPVVRVGDIAASVSETHPMRKDRLIFLNTSDILHGKILHHTYTPVSTWPGQAKKSIQHGDILFSEIRPANGRWAYVKGDAEDIVVSTKLMVIRTTKNTTLSEYLYHFLTSQNTTAWLQHLAESRSGTFPQITFDQVASLEMPLPSLHEQKAIAHTLNTLDDKIDLNRRINKSLEAVAQALFKSFFLEHAQDRLPKGWSIGKLSDVADIVMGLSPTGDSYNTNGNGIPLINGPVEFGEYFPVKSKWTTAPTRLAQPGDLILCVRGSTTGRRVVADDEYCLGRGVCAIRAKSKAHTFLYKTIDFRLDTLLSKTTGSVFPSLSAPDIKGLPVVVPPPQAVALFSDQAEPLTTKIQANTHESRTLAHLRDTLLPKLLSGELRVETAESAMNT